MMEDYPGPRDDCHLGRVPNTWTGGSYRSKDLLNGQGSGALALNPDNIGVIQDHGSIVSQPSDLESIMETGYQNKPLSKGQATPNLWIDTLSTFRPSAVQSVNPPGQQPIHPFVVEEVLPTQPKESFNPLRRSSIQSNTTLCSVITSVSVDSVDSHRVLETDLLLEDGEIVQEPSENQPQERIITTSQLDEGSLAFVAAGISLADSRSAIRSTLGQRSKTTSRLPRTAYVLDEQSIMDEPNQTYGDLQPSQPSELRLIPRSRSLPCSPRSFSSLPAAPADLVPITFVSQLDWAPSEQDKDGLPSEARGTLVSPGMLPLPALGESNTIGAEGQVPTPSNRSSSLLSPTAAYPPYLERPRSLSLLSPRQLKEMSEDSGRNEEDDGSIAALRVAAKRSMVAHDDNIGSDIGKESRVAGPKETTPGRRRYSIFERNTGNQSKSKLFKRGEGRGLDSPTLSFLKLNGSKHQSLPTGLNPHQPQSQSQQQQSSASGISSKKPRPPPFNMPFITFQPHSTDISTERPSVSGRLLLHIPRLPGKKFQFVSLVLHLKLKESITWTRQDLVSFEIERHHWGQTVWEKKIPLSYRDKQVNEDCGNGISEASSPTFPPMTNDFPPTNQHHQTSSVSHQGPKVKEPVDNLKGDEWWWEWLIPVTRQEVRPESFEGAMGMVWYELEAKCTFRWEDLEKNGQSIVASPVASTLNISELQRASGVRTDQSVDNGDEQSYGPTALLKKASSRTFSQVFSKLRLGSGSSSNNKSKKTQPAGDFKIASRHEEYIQNCLRKAAQDAEAVDKEVSKIVNLTAFEERIQYLLSLGDKTPHSPASTASTGNSPRQNQNQHLQTSSMTTSSSSSGEPSSLSSPLNFSSISMLPEPVPFLVRKTLKLYFIRPPQKVTLSPPLPMMNAPSMAMPMLPGTRRLKAIIPGARIQVQVQVPTMIPIPGYAFTSQLMPNSKTGELVPVPRTNAGGDHNDRHYANSGSGSSKNKENKEAQDNIRPTDYGCPDNFQVALTIRKVTQRDIDKSDILRRRYESTSATSTPSMGGGKKSKGSFNPGSSASSCSLPLPMGGILGSAQQAPSSSRKRTMSQHGDLSKMADGSIPGAHSGDQAPTLDVPRAWRKEIRVRKVKCEFWQKESCRIPTEDAPSRSIKFPLAPVFMYSDKDQEKELALTSSKLRQTFAWPSVDTPEPTGYQGYSRGNPGYGAGMADSNLGPDFDSTSLSSQYDSFLDGLDADEFGGPGGVGGPGGFGTGSSHSHHAIRSRPPTVKPRIEVKHYLSLRLSIEVLEHEGEYEDDDEVDLEAIEEQQLMLAKDQQEISFYGRSNNSVPSITGTMANGGNASPYSPVHGPSSPVSPSLSPGPGMYGPAAGRTLNPTRNAHSLQLPSSIISSNSSSTIAPTALGYIDHGLSPVGVRPMFPLSISPAIQFLNSTAGLLDVELDASAIGEVDDPMSPPGPPPCAPFMSMDSAFDPNRRRGSSGSIDSAKSNGSAKSLGAESASRVQVDQKQTGSTTGGIPNGHDGNRSGSCGTAGMMFGALEAIKKKASYSALASVMNTGSTATSSTPSPSAGHYGSSGMAKIPSQTQLKQHLQQPPQRVGRVMVQKLKDFVIQIPITIVIQMDDATQTLSTYGSVHPHSDGIIVKPVPSFEGSSSGISAAAQFKNTYIANDPFL
ncbi:hypothetical protein BGW38_000133 [Lunasporangiospora selenospora]|uniref:Uncharacterized protein n=1 Tax=Lunasporangiospora selenospora TaxID=979761 RepID=A0A9P6G306_9FUNG|nr:hypothetical protein BGW38_000133 [Lunasporangiospora selenospora]